MEQQRARQALIPMLASNRQAAESPTTSPTDYQREVDEHFYSASSFWEGIYESRTVEGVVYRLRQERILKWIDELNLPVGSPILEIGCGAGGLTVELAERGYEVYALDTNTSMVEMTRTNAAERDVISHVHAGTGDAHRLEFSSNSFPLVVAVGVIPWLYSPEDAVSEFSRVITPDGHLIVTSDNRARLTYLLDPRFNPLLLPLKRRVKRVIESLGFWSRRQKNYCSADSRRYVNRLLHEKGLIKIKDETAGFGPVTFLAKRIVPEALGLILHRILQSGADAEVPVLRSLGSHYLVLAGKAMDGPTCRRPRPPLR